MTDEPAREIPESEIGEGTGARDAVAPVQGAVEQRKIDFNAVYEGLPNKDRSKFAEQLLQGERTPEQLWALHKQRRDTIRLWLTIILVASVVAEAGVAVYLAQANQISWDHLKDWLTLSVAPLAAAMGVAATFWFPSKETD